MPRKTSNRLNGRWHVGICSLRNKRQFTSEEDARKEAKRVRKLRGAKLRPYKCKACPYWHLGHQRNFKKREYLRKKAAVDKALNQSGS